MLRALMLFIPAALALTSAPQARADRGAANARQACPDVAGHYRVAGFISFSDALADTLNALGATSASYPGSEVKLSGRAEEGLSAWVKSGPTGAMSTSPRFVLVNGTDFSCKDGWIILNRAARANRRTDQGWHEGQSSVRLAPGHGGGLTIQTTFTGSQQSNLFAYESARISVPKPFTSITLSESIRWPDISEPDTENPTPIEVPPEPTAALKVRQMLDAKVLGNAMLGGLRVHGNAVLVSLKVPRSGDVVRLEDRLRAAAISYEVKVPPIWSDNSYHMELLVKPARAELAYPGATNQRIAR